MPKAPPRLAPSTGRIERRLRDTQPGGRTSEIGTLYANSLRAGRPDGVGEVAAGVGAGVVAPHAVGEEGHRQAGLAVAPADRRAEPPCQNVRAVLVAPAQNRRSVGQSPELEPKPRRTGTSKVRSVSPSTSIASMRATVSGCRMRTPSIAPPAASAA